MDKKSKICIWIIVLGLGNFFLYTVLYMFIGGEAVNGKVFVDDLGNRTYYLQSGQMVSFGEFLYSGVHSISVWLTVAAIMLALLTLARENIVSAMRSTVVHGRTFITILATLIAFTVAIITVWFVLQFAGKLSHPEPVPTAPKAARIAA